MTCWLWRISFMRSFSQVTMQDAKFLPVQHAPLPAWPSNILSVHYLQGATTVIQRFEPVLILADCIQVRVMAGCSGL
jgi:hypothetical protein